MTALPHLQRPRYGVAAVAKSPLADGSRSQIGLTMIACVGTIANMDAVPIESRKNRYSDGTIVQVVIWQVPVPVPGSSHTYKYSLFFGGAGHRHVGYDNERGKGDHKHVGQIESRYRFSDIATLLADFEADVAKWRAEQ